MITLSDKYIDVLNKVAAALSEDGLIIDRIYPFGVIKGHASEYVITKLKRHEEVQEVKEETTVTIAPPRHKIQ